MTMTSAHPELPMLKVEPVADPLLGVTFSVNITLEIPPGENITNLWGWQMKLGYNTTILDATGVSLLLGHPFEGKPYDSPVAIEDARGYILFCVFFVPVDQSVNVTTTKPLAKITFNSTTYGSSALTFQRINLPGGTYLADKGGIKIPFTPVDGSVTVAPRHDIAITGITTSETTVGQGHSLIINVTVANQGDYTENFNTIIHANTTSIALQPVTLTNRNSTTITFTWYTTDFACGIYTIWAEATVVPEETDTVDNTLIDGTILIIPNFHDVAITNVRISHNFVYQGENVSIYVDAWNSGAFPETFNVAAHADENTTVIGDEITIKTQSLSLPIQGFATLTFTWNTTGVSSGNYTISAVASNVTDEADSTDNLYVNGKIVILVSVPCYDINIISPIYVTLNPSIFQFNWTVGALEASLGDMTIVSTGYEGLLRVLGSTTDAVHLRVNQPNLELADHYLPQSGSVKVPLWLLFEPGTYSGTYELQLTICGTHRLKITVNIVHIWVCGNGAYTVEGGTVTFSYTLEGGSWVYLEAEPNLPPGWNYTVDPPTETLFETPHEIIVNITAAPDAVEGDIGSVTIRAYKNETNILIWQYTFFASVDNNPPTIETIQPPTLTFTGDLLFNTTLKDASGIESVQLYYSVNSGPWYNQTMQWDSGDTFNSTLYKLTIPHVPDNSVINYYIVATDWLRNQIQSDIKTIIVKYDLAIAEVETSKTVIGQGSTIQINVTVVNQGTIPGTSLEIALYANTTLIDTQTIKALTNGTAITLTFQWNTTGFSKGTYHITAFAIPILGETGTTDNIFVKGSIQVTILGDVNGDGYVEMMDYWVISQAYGSKPGDPNWNPNADIYDPPNGDGMIEMMDYWVISQHYGEHYP
jgi:hypothetical protein